MLKKRVLAWVLAITMVIAYIPYSPVSQVQEVSAALETGYLMELTDDDANLIDVSRPEDKDSIVDYNYLTYPGFDVLMYNNDYNGMFGDEHLSGITLILHGQRIAGNGDIHLLPVPEQWDAAAPASSSPISPANQVGTTGKQPREYDYVNNTITLPMKYVYATGPTVTTEKDMEYDLVAKPEPGGVELSVILREDMPPELENSASFNLEFIPSLYKNKSYRVDSDKDGTYDIYGVFPLAPEDPMDEDWPRPTLQGNAWYVDQWNTEKGPWQPRPLARGYQFNLAPEDEISHVSVSSDRQMSIYDGRNRSQNGWFTLTERIAPGSKAGQTVVKWHIKAPVQSGWTREPNIAHSQAGYGTGLKKVAVMEIDKNDTSPPLTAQLMRLEADGSYSLAFQGNLGEARRWTRYDYRDFDFSSVNVPGLYAIRYDGITTDIFPISDNVYDNIWQPGLSGFLATAMDHMEVREGYRIWHGAAHMDDARIGEPFENSPTSGTSIPWFDGQGVALDALPDVVKAKGLEIGSRVPGMAVGGWFDAGDFDIELGSNMNVLRNLIYTAEAFENLDGYDTLAVEWSEDTGGSAEMHKPDGVPDIVQQVKHGALQIRANIENVGVVNGVIEVPTLRQYTHLGDGSTDTDGFIYDPKLDENDIVERDGKVYSGKNDDRMIMMYRNTGTTGVVPTALLGNPSIGMAGAAAVLRGFDNGLADLCLETAESIWENEGPAAMAGADAALKRNAFNTLVQLVLASDAAEDETRLAKYKGLIEALLSGAGGGNPFLAAGLLPINTHYTAALIMDQMGGPYAELVKAAALAAVDGGLYAFAADTPFGFSESLTATWGPGSGKIGSGLGAAMLLKTFEGRLDDSDELETFKVLEDHVIRAMNYTMGTHPYNSTSWLTGVGANSHKYPYNSNRGEEGFIPGSIVPGYINFRPDFPESLDNFSFLWAENECTVGVVSTWIAPAKMAAEIAARRAAPAAPAASKDFSNTFMMHAEEAPAPPDIFGAPVFPAASLKTQGFDLFMYNTTFSPVFGDQHCAGVELIQNGRRIATNGDIHLLPTPEQWDATPAPILNGRGADLENNTVSATLTIPGSDTGGVELAEVKYTIKAEPEAGGVKLSLILDAPLPPDLAGKAGFNLEFMPNLYREKGFQADKNGDGTYDDFGIFPLLPFADMEEKDRARTVDQAWYVKEWNKDRGDYQPVPFAKGKSIVLAPEDSENRIRVKTDTGDLELFDGRNRSQNGWFVLRTLIPAGGTQIVWHISPDIEPGWAREPNVGHSQAGYAPVREKVAVIELDPAFSAPGTATVERLNDDGTYTAVFTGPLGPAKRWLRYDYRDFDFTSVNAPGVYTINYAGKRTDVFRIADDVYDKSWQTALSGFLAKEMDHIAVRDAYKIVHAASHMDDAIMWPIIGEPFRDEESFDGSWFDGQDFMETSRGTDEYGALEHIQGLAVGGWYDAGDFDVEATRNQGVIQDLAMAYTAFKPDYDTMAVEWNEKTGGMVELHRPDGVPDIVQQVKHGAMQVFARLEAIGYNFKVLEVPTLRQYTHLGDGARDTDGYIYDPDLKEDERVGLRSGKNDDRLAMVGSKSTSLQYGAAAALASAAYVMASDYTAESGKYLAAAEQIWNEEPHPAISGAGDAFSVSDEWNAAIQLLIATGGDKKYLDRIYQMAPAMLSMADLFPPFGIKPFTFAGGWKAVSALPYMNTSFKSSFTAAVSEYVADLDRSLEENPFGVPSTNGMWGGSTDVVDMGMRMYYLHKALPEIVSSDYTLRAANYILGTHPYDDVSWLSGVGTSSVEHAYGNTRADDTFVAGGIVPGYVNISPDFPEAQSEFGMMWFESEYVIDTSAKWIAVGNAAAELAKAAPAYTVIYVANGGSGSVVSDGVFSEGDNVAVKSSYGMTMAGYRFTAWNTAADGSGTAYMPGDAFEMGAGNVVLYAQWAPVSASPSSPSGPSGSGSGGSPAVPPPAGGDDAAPPSQTGPTGLAAAFSDAGSIAGWAAPFVERLLTAGIISGRADGSFDPKGNVSRAEFTKMIVNALDIRAGSAPKAFEDVGAGSWFKEFVDRASSNGLINGTSDTMFEPDATITRQDLCVIAYNALKGLGATAGPEGGFTDGDAISAYAREAVYALKQLGIISGRDDGRFDPLATASREEAAKIICGVMDYAASRTAAAQTAGAAEGEAESAAATEPEATEPETATPGGVAGAEE
ncbi:MAG: S-layer homology domain-containing protein [Clostridiales Family XIII bacterium]|jgi:hypothetical protein|nr:S-layer homology domain-containing protein [Clostridiales Family XIII bacterium]